MGEEVKIAYLCDGLDKCSEKPGCFRCKTEGFQLCRHTLNAEHALNGLEEHPEDHPERFLHLDTSTNVNMPDSWWEYDPYNPAETSI